MKPLEKSRRLLNWIGVHFADAVPVSRRLQLAQNVSAIAYAIVFLVILTLHLMTFLNVHLEGPQDFFYELLQIIMVFHVTSSYITVYSHGSHIVATFQSLTEIYKKCKKNESRLDLLLSKRK